MPGPAPPMTTHRFAPTSLYADYARAAGGFALTFGPLVVLDPAPVLAWIFAGLALLFAWFGLRTLMRQMSRIEMGAAEIALLGPRPRTIRWDELREVRLSYFAPRRARKGRDASPAEGSDGWLQLTLIDGEGRRLDVDSTLDDFGDVLLRAHRVARSLDLPLEPATAANFAAVGFASDEPDDRPPPNPSPPRRP